MENQVAFASRPHPNSGKMLLVLSGILAILVVGVAVMFLMRQQAAGAEEDAVKQLKEMGALIVPNSAGQATSAVVSIPGRDIDLSLALPLVSKLKRLESLDASNSSINNEQLELIGRVTWLTNLNLSNTPVGDEQVKYISGLSKLKSLYLANTKITSASLHELAKIKTLEMLDINGSTISGGFEPLAGLTSLTMLVASGLSVGDEDAEALTKIPNLRRVDLTGAEISSEALEMLQAKIPQIGR